MPSTGLRTAPPGPPGTRDVPARGRRPHRMWLRWWHPVRMYRVRGYAVAWLFLLPALLLFTYFKFIPMARAVQLSFYEVLYKGDVWVGNANYREVVTDSSFLSAIWHTVELAVGQTAGSIVLGLFLALLLEGQARYLWFIRSAVFLPTVAAMAVVAEVWRVLYYPASVGIWRGAPYDMMIFLAGLAGVDRTLYEAAAVDGANVLRRIWHVTFPALRPVFAILMTLAAIRGLRVFTEVYLLTGGAPNGSTEVLMTLIFKLGLERGELGVAAAGSMVLLGATVVLTVAVQAARRRGLPK